MSSAKRSTIREKLQEATLRMDNISTEAERDRCATARGGGGGGVLNALPPKSSCYTCFGCASLKLKLEDLWSAFVSSPDRFCVNLVLGDVVQPKCNNTSTPTTPHKSSSLGTYGNFLNGAC